jgi:hypothetical protein
MNKGIDIYCSTCFAIRGELCRTKYLVHGQDEVTPVICPIHSSRLVDIQRDSNRHLCAARLLAMAHTILRDT